MIKATVYPAAKKYQFYFELLFVFLSYIGLMFFLFNTQISSNFNLLTGDRFDGIIESSLLEHWYNVFRGYSSWNTVGYFYPYNDTLAYNDGYFLYGVISSLFRMLGIDLFLASDCVNFTLKTIGYFSFYYLCRFCIGMRPGYAFTGTVIFTLANSLTIQNGHAQLLSICLAPLLTILLFRYIDNYLHAGPRAITIAWGAGGGILMAAWLITTFYMAWFFIFFTMIFTLTVIILNLWNYHKKSSILIKFPLRLWELAVPFVITVLATIPFLYVYIPKIKETGMHSYSTALAYTPNISNLFYPSSENMLFGSFFEKIFNNHFPGVQRSGELLIGFPPVILLVSLCALFYFWHNKKNSIDNILIKSLAFSLFISFAFMVKFSDFTLWKVIWETIPGAKGIRVTARFALFLIFPMSILSSYYLMKASNGRYLIPVFFLSTIMILEQINLTKSQYLNRSEQIAFIQNVPPPPNYCRVFFVAEQREKEISHSSENPILNIYPHNVDAMLISEFFQIRTINGFSTFTPPGWDFKLNPQDSYLRRVNDYIKNANITNGICMYNLKTKTWTDTVTFPTEAR